MTRKAIFEQGMGVDPDPQKFGAASGVALKYLYSLLELKSGFMETEFKMGFGQLIRAICRHFKMECGQIIQTWTRTAISNDTELAEICKNSVGIVSKKSILKAHPFVEDTETELEQLEAEEKETQEKADLYAGIFDQMKNGVEKDRGDEQ